jgi:hypothetical protein
MNPQRDTAPVLEQDTDPVIAVGAYYLLALSFTFLCIALFAPAQ